MTRERIARAATVLSDVAAFAIPTAVYVASASHEPASWDTAELQGVPYILGISHPTGFPLFVLLGYLWSHVIAVGSVAFRMNAMSAVCLGVAALMAYAVALRIGASRPVLRHRLLPWARRERPCRRRAAEKRDKVASFQ